MRILRGRYTEVYCPNCGFISLQRGVRTKLLTSKTRLYMCKSCGSVVGRTISDKAARSVVRENEGNVGRPSP
jgi:predicted RNA-binding Zn-ribbon protein involved in translation (DUF1610 family)